MIGMRNTYKISAYTLAQAKKIGVTVQVSTRKGKKLDVFKDGRKVATIGALGYMDYPAYLELYGPEYANKRRDLYRIRHAKDREVEFSNGWYADKLLW